MSRRAAFAQPASARGISLVELMVAMAIGLVVTLAITRVMISFDSSKRTSSSVNEAVQSGVYVGQLLDRSIRSAGSGYTQRNIEFFGCTLNARRPGASVTLFPPPATFPAPFEGASLVRRLAPVLIESGAADTATQVRGDILTVMSGTAGGTEVPQVASGFDLVPTPQYSVSFGGEYRAGDLVLIGGTRLSTGSRDCMIQQVQSVVGASLRLGGAFYAAAGSSANFEDFDGRVTYSTRIGNVADSNFPAFQMFAVGDKDTLFRYDLLQAAGTAIENAPQAIADGIVEIRALYGIDDDPGLNTLNHVLDYWQQPDVAPYRYQDLTSGTAVSFTNLRRITAVRLGIIMRSALPEKDVVTPTDPVLFDGVVDRAGASLRRTRPLAAEDRYYRYRTVEMTIPLRNMQLAPLR